MVRRPQRFFRLKPLATNDAAAHYLKTIQTTDVTP